MRLLVCGSREWLGAWEEIGGQLPDVDDLTVIHGACSSVVGGVQRSVDMLADFVARGLGYHVDPYPVDHALDGPWPGAGPKRNARMLRDGRLTHGLAFGPLWRVTGRVTGTGDMVRRMLTAGLPVRWVAAPGFDAVDLTEMPSAAGAALEDVRR